MSANQKNRSGDFEDVKEAMPRLPLRVWIIGIIVFILFSTFNRGITLYTDWLWFKATGFAQIFTTELTAKIAVFFAVALVFVLFFLLNAFLARWQVKRNTLFFSDEVLVTQRVVGYAIWGVALLLAWLVGSTASANWLTVLEYLRQVPFGTADPIFGRDVAFYVFTLPLLKFVQGWVVVVLFLSLFGAAGIYLLEQRNNLEEGRVVILPHVQLHLSILGALIFVAFAWGHWMDTFELQYSTRGVVFGASYTDITILLPVLRILMGIAILSALMLLVNIFVRRNTLPMAAIFIWLIGGFLLRGIVPGVVQRFVVEPNELTREAPYIEYNIEFTNRAYNLHNITVKEFENIQSLSAQDLEDNTATLENIRLWDYRPLLQTFRQLQELRLYYTFLDVELDRYQINGKYRKVALSVRELDKLQLQSPTWINQKLQFTHGYGVVLNPVNEVTSEGLPNLWVEDLPPRSSIDLPISRPEVYFGENTGDYVFVNTGEKEFDYPGVGDEAVYTTYGGTGGVRLDNYLKRLAFAFRLTDSNIVLSRDITVQSKVLLNRNVRARAQELAPFLNYDEDPYIVIGQDGKLYWILDAYTTSNLYPYSERVGNRINYIRNSIKVVIDPYNGDVSFYLFDPTDPLAQTYGRIFPDLLKPASQMPETLRSHVRYPEGLFTIQANLYRTYHMQDPKVFYNQEDLWAIPQETFSGNTQSVEPYYIIARLPGEEADEFILIQPLTPFNKDNLVAWLAARSDGEHYGQLVVYRFPKQELVFGPLQIEARIDQDPEISSQFSLWDQGGSQVIRGNLLVLPMGNALLYVEPIYLQAESGRIPELKRVILSSGDQVIMANTLADGLAQLLGGLTPAVAEVTSPVGQESQPATGPTVDRTVRQLAEAASAHYEAAQKALQEGDWAAYGAELEAMETALNQLLESIEE
ncbi:MAG: UPF0182 family protein [Anaerolineae bacterium]